MIEILAPAKLNLGLEIIGRRDDGFHEIRSVMAPVSLVDRLVLSPSDKGRLSIGGVPVETTGNLVCAAISLASAAWRLQPVNAVLTKRIPLSSGLGGGSSDAAATLLALAHLFGKEQATLAPMALRLGSDVPFFLAGGSATVGGRGELVTPALRHHALDAVVVVPPMTIPRKTATMYGMLRRDDLSDGSAVERLASDPPALVGRRELLPNAFRRPLYAHVPALNAFAQLIEATSSLPANLTGAGPAHFVLCRDPEHASCAAGRLRSAFAGSGVSIFAVRSMNGIHIREVVDAERDA